MFVPGQQVCRAEGIKKYQPLKIGFPEVFFSCAKPEYAVVTASSNKEVTVFFMI
jgi:hypothetical protein